MKNWGTRDWFWLVGILIGVDIMTVAIRLNDNDNVVNIISLLASASSITLAIIAIWQSSTYNSQSNEVFNSLKDNLNILKQNVDTIKQNIIKEANTAIDNSQISEDEKVNLKTHIENAIINPIQINLLKFKINLEFDVKIPEGERDKIFDEIINKTRKFFGVLYMFENIERKEETLIFKLIIKPGAAAGGNPEMVIDDIIKSAIINRKDLIKYEIMISKSSS